jgi:hypothetical protein
VPISNADPHPPEPQYVSGRLRRLTPRTLTARLTAKPDIQADIAEKIGHLWHVKQVVVEFVG